jgi:leucyl aminopeptidase
MTPINAFTSDSAGALPLHVLDKATFAAWLDAQPAATQAWLSSQQFTAAPGSVALLPGSDGLAGAVLGVGDRADAHAYAHAPFALPAGSRWQLANTLDAAELANLHLGWGLGSYRFARYRKPARLPAQLAATPSPEVLDVLAA